MYDWYYPPPAPPPPEIRIHKGAACVFQFSPERWVFCGRSVGKISRESPGKGVFFAIANGNQYPR